MDKGDWQCFRAWLARSFAEPNNLPNYLTALFTLGLMIFACAAWLESQATTAALQEQIKVGQSQLSLTQQTARQQLRAYLILDRLSSAPQKIESDGGAYFRFTAKNYGATPAMGAFIRWDEDLHVVTRIEGALSEPTLAPWPATTPTNNPIAPGAPLLWQVPKRFDKAELDRLRTGKYVVVYTGTIYYEDIFESRQRSPFCVWFEFAPEPREDQPLVSDRLGGCHVASNPS
jgi:hypothetical protein